ncbi:MAG: hypothetical protein WD847_02460 [Pirellulales bacterium]
MDNNIAVKRSVWQFRLRDLFALLSAVAVLLGIGGVIGYRRAMGLGLIAIAAAANFWLVRKLVARRPPLLDAPPPRAAGWLPVMLYSLTAASLAMVPALPEMLTSSILAWSVMAAIGGGAGVLVVAAATRAGLTTTSLSRVAMAVGLVAASIETVAAADAVNGLLAGWIADTVAGRIGLQFSPLWEVGFLGWFAWKRLLPDPETHGGGPAIGYMLAVLATLSLVQVELTALALVANGITSWFLLVEAIRMTATGIAILVGLPLALWAAACLAGCRVAGREKGGRGRGDKGRRLALR